MRAYEVNKSLFESDFYIIQIAFERDVWNLSLILGKKLEYDIDLGLVKDNNEYIKVARALNFLGICLVPYGYKQKSKKCDEIYRKGFTDIATVNTIYINYNIPVMLVQRVALYNFIHVIKFINLNLYDYLSSLLNKETDYIAFCNSPLNKQLLKDVNCPIEAYNDETLANFFSFNPANKQIPFAFFDKINYNVKNIILPTKPFNQQKYFDILFNIVSMLRG